MAVKTKLCSPSHHLFSVNKQLHLSTAVIGSIQLFHRRLDTIKREATLSQPARFIHPNQTVVRYDMQTGRKQTCEDVPARFYRFANGLWLRAVAGRDRKMWKKHRKRRRRNKQFVFCNKTQSLMLDRMVTMEYKTRRYYPDDPLQQFQDRNFCGLKKYPGRNFIMRHQKKFREPSASDPVDQQIHQSFGVNKYYKPKK